MTPKPTSDQPHADLSPGWGPAILLVIIGVLTQVWWGRWPHAFLDFGREVYTAWCVAEGGVLYRDLFSLHGPFSPHLNALIFSLFGPSIPVLAAANLVVIILITLISYNLLRQIGNRYSATLACAASISIFFFGHYIEEDNFNFLTPYVHEATHGVLLCLLLILLLVREFNTPLARTRTIFLSLAGIVFGCTLLTKFDIVVASSAILVSTLVMERRRLSAQSCLALLVGLSLPILGFFLFYSQFFPAREALGYILHAITLPITKGGEFSAQPYFLQSVGLDHPLENLKAIGRMSLLVVGLLIAALYTGSSVKRPHSILIPIVFGVALFSLLFVAPSLLPWLTLPQALWALVAIVVLSSYRIVTSSTPHTTQDLIFVLWSVFAIVLLSRMGLHLRFFHYGFYLAFPATALVILCAAHRLPSRLKTAKDRQFLHAVVAGFVGGMIATYLRFSLHYQEQISYVLPEAGWIGFHPDSNAATRTMEQLLPKVKAIAAQGETFTVLPAGSLLNFLARTPSPFPLTTAGVPEFIAFGVDNATAALSSAAPEWIIVTASDASEFGVGGPFGHDYLYGSELLRWIHSSYQQVDASYGREGEFTATLYRRASLSTPPPADLSISPSR